MMSKMEDGFRRLSTGSETCAHSVDEEGEGRDREPSASLGCRDVPLSALITGIGNFSIQMNYQSISTALMVMSVAVCTSTLQDCKSGVQAPWVASSNAATVFAGSIMGQLCMGYAGDVLGVDKALSLTMSISLVAILCSSLLTLFFPEESADGIYITIMVSRFFLGIGLGGVYPLSATKSAEACTDTSKSDHLTVSPLNSARSFFWQIPGAVTPWLLLLAMTHSELSTAVRWRLLLGLGAIPNIMVLICLQVEKKQEGGVISAENELVSEADIGGEDDVELTPIIHHASESGNNTSTDNKSSSVLKQIWVDESFVKHIIGTGGSWFLFDICYYGVLLFGGDIVEAIRLSHNDNGDDLTEDITTDSNLQYIALHQVLALSMGVPGVILSILLLGHWSAKTIQMIGFLAMSVMFCCMAILFEHLKEKSPDLLYALYCLLLFTLQFGPNVTTFVLPAMVYRHEVRSTMTGISAALGKVGAVCGAYIFGSLVIVVGFPALLMVCAGLSLLGVYVTYVCITVLEGEKESSSYRCNTRSSESESVARDDECLL